MKVRSAVSEDSFDHRTAMTVSVQKPLDATETRTELAQNSFETMPLWMLQRYVTAEVYPSLSECAFSDVSELIDSARNPMSERMLDREELLHTPPVGIKRHVDGRGRCFLHSRRILLGVNECPELQRQKLLNQLIDSPKMYLGLETAQQVMLNEQD